MPTEIRAKDKHNTLLCKIEKDGILLYNKNTRQEEKLTWDDIEKTLERE